MLIKQVFICLAACVVASANFVYSANPNNEVSDTVALQEIIVEASREQYSLKKLPASAAIVNAQRIENNGIKTLADVSAVVANLFMPDYGSKLTSPIYIRGIGSRINAPSVGLYVDNVPYFEKSAFNFEFFDINRIEVLRGPQGTSHGRNTMGGIINVLSKSPLNYQGTDINIGAATYGNYQVGVSHYNKPSDKFAFSVAANYRHSDGFFYNEFLEKNVDVLDAYSFRNRLIVSPTKKFSIENIFSFEKSSEGGYPYASLNASTQLPNAIAYDAESGYTRNLLSDALVLKYDDEKFVFKAVSSYQYMRDKQMIDQDFSTVSQFFVTQNQKQHMFSQELSLQSKNTERYSWLFGTHFFVQQFYNDVIVDVLAAKMQTDKAYDQKLDGIAFYHQSTFDDVLIPNLSVSAGVRVGTESNTMAYVFYRQMNTNRSLMVDTVYNGISSFQVLPKFTMSYAFGASNAYASVTRGFKTGGYNITFERPEDLSFEPEYSWNYELGFKSALFNNHLFVEASAFYVDWSNQQIYQTVPSGTGSMLKNAGETVSKGLELNVSTGSIYGFTFAGAYGLTHATFVKNVLNANTHYNGNFVPYVPRHTLALQANKSINLQSKWLNSIVLSAIYKGNGDIYWNEKNTAKQDYYGTLDARVSFVRGNMSLDIWGSNLTRTSYNAFFFEALGKSFVQQGKPMQGGVKINLKI